MKKSFLNLLLVLIPLLSFAQLTYPSETISVQPSTTIDVSALTEYEKANPQILVARDFEEDEDEKDAIEKFHEVTPENMANTVIFDFDTPQVTDRAASPAPITNFNALDDNGASIPPDIHAAAGPNHLMVTLNTQYRIQDKNGVVLSTVTANGFWAGTGGTNPSTFDPKILYDSYSNRWVLVSCAGARSSTSALLVAVSQTSDPTGTWNRFSIDADAANTSWFDYPSLGINKDWIVVMGNMFPNSGSGYNGGKIWVLNKANAYANSIASLTTINSGTSTFTLCPAVTYDNTIGTVYMVQEYNNSSGGNAFLEIFSLSGTTPTLTNLGTCSTNLPYNWDGVSGAPQLGSTNKITTNDSRIQNVVFRNGSLYIAHNIYMPITTPTRTSIQWWKVNAATRAVEQAGRVDDATGANHYGFPSVMPNAAGDMALGYSRFSATTYASAGYSFRYATDPLNTLNDPYIYKAGANTYYKTFSGTSNRWGDYTATALDPDGSTFWIVQEYARSTVNTWGTWWAKVAATPAVPCANAPTGLASSALSSTSATLSWTADAAATSYNLEYKTSAATIWTTVSGITSATYNLSGLTAATTYNFKVQSVCGAASSSYSSEANFTTAAAPCAIAPTGLAATAITSSSATFGWAATSGATSYNVDYKTAAATTWTTLTSTTNSLAIAGLTASTAYDYRVEAVCGATTSGYSATAAFTTLASGCADIGEPNNTLATAATIAVNTNANALIASATDLDYYKFTTTATQNLSVTLTGLPADYDSKMFNTAGTQVGGSQNGGTNSETMNYANAPAGTYTVYVYGYSSAFNATQCYTLRANTSASSGCTNSNEPNETIAAAVAITPNIDITGQIATGTDKDYLKFTTTATSNITVTLTTLPKNYHLKLYNSAGTQIGSSTKNGTQNESIALTNQAAGTYTAYVYPATTSQFSTTACYTLKVAVANGSFAPVLEGDNQSTITDAATAPKEITLYPNPANQRVTVFFDHNANETVRLEIFNQAGREVLMYNVALLNAENKFDLELTDLPTGTYMVRMKGNNWVKTKKLVILNR